MILLPAIDIRGGRAVRLERGDFDRETVYGDSPLEAARAWVDAGARALHVVDLDGALAGKPASLDHLGAIAGDLGVPVQYGGGLRSLDAIGAAIHAGAARVVLGTAAFRDPDLLDAALAAWRDRIAVAIDVRDGRVAVAGWTESTGSTPEEVIGAMERRGVERLVLTSVDRDGMLSGPDLEGLRRVAAAAGANLLYSGGIGSVEDLRALAALELPRLEGVIAGKALYEQRFSVAEGQAALDSEGPVGSTSARGTSGPPALA